MREDEIRESDAYPAGTVAASEDTTDPADRDDDCETPRRRDPEPCPTCGGSGHIRRRYIGCADGPCGFCGGTGRV